MKELQKHIALLIKKQKGEVLQELVCDFIQDYLDEKYYLISIKFCRSVYKKLKTRPISPEMNTFGEVKGTWL